jgi:hypothetical protein
MLKGVNKLIVEVANPDSEFFERAIFFVRPQMKNTSPNELNKSADALITGAAKPKGKSRFSTKLGYAGAAGAGAAVAAVLLLLLS